MPISPTRFSRISVGFVSSDKSLKDVDAADTGAVFSVTGPMNIGSATAAHGIAAFSSATAAVSLGAILPLESSSVQTVGLSGATRGDTLILTVDSIYPNVAANRDVFWMCSSSSTVGEVHVWGVNSTLTSVTPTASTLIRVSRINHPSYI